MKVKFVDMSRDTINPDAPNERPGDPSLGKEWVDNPEVQAAYLSILCWYYESLERNFGGKLLSVPHPHIKAETEDFRNSQDRINKFFSMYLVKCEGKTERTPMGDIIKKYALWHQSQYPDDASFKYGLIDKIEGSRINKNLVDTRRGKYLQGFRVLDMSESKTDGEQYCDQVGEERKIDVMPENSEDYYDRICREYDTGKFEAAPDVWKPQVDVPAADSDIDDEIQEFMESRPSVNQKKAKGFRASNLSDPVDEDEFDARQAMMHALNRGETDDEDSDAAEESDESDA
jgi:hypothetical protein